MLKGTTVLLGITGSVAAYKAVELAKRLRQEGASVRVIMTEASKRFITPLSLELAVNDTVYTDMFSAPLSHVALPAGADLFIVAPATANCINKYAGGIADDFLSTALLAFTGKVILAPAMNWRMYANPIVQRNLRYLESLGVRTVGPEQGSLACGEEGMGRLADIDTIIEAVVAALTPPDLAGEQVLVTAGPTREYIDPVRFLSNRSSGKMGYALALAARRRGAEVTLISGPVALPAPEGVEVVRVETATEMHTAAMDGVSLSSLFIAAAAVADYMVAEPKSSKMEKKEKVVLTLVRTPDILEAVGKLKNKPFTVGFAAETGNRLDRARKKLQAKNVDMIVFNDVSKAGAGFDVDTNEVVIIDREREQALPVLTKREVAAAVLDRALELKGG